MSQTPPNDRLVLFEVFGQHSLIMRDVADGRLYQRLLVPTTLSTRWNCVCHPQLHYRRPHFTCVMFCRIKRVAQGQLPPLIPVNQYRFYIHLDRAHARFKDWLLRKFVLPIAEWLAN